MSNVLKLFSLMIVPCMVGCTLLSSQEPAPVVELKEQSKTVKNTHVVQRGETLYEIAWRYGQDYRDIAFANRIASPYVIYVGQRLKVTGVATLPRKTFPTLVPQQVKEKPSVIKASIPPAPISIATSSSFANTWIWPVNGKIVKPYSISENKGVDIGGQIGTPIMAAEAGKVVYSGAGLRGYGLLIIIKHNDTYLSAYAHNSRLLVQEGAQVNKGQVIAEMGQSDADSVKLHFEIRKNGQPINPMNLLPA